MSKAVKPLLLAGAIVAVGVATGGISLGFTGAALGAGEFGASLAVGLSTTAFGSSLLLAAGATALSGVSAALAKTPKIGLSNIERLNASLVPSAARKAVFGRTAMATDIRYVEPSGTNQEYIDYVFHFASHRCGSVDEIWFDDKLAWNSAGGAQGIYAGYLTVETILQADSTHYHTVSAGASWGSAQRLTGCCTGKVRIKRTGATSKASSPFASGLPGRMCVVGKGMPVYSPALDSTVSGGSGAHRANDCSTWEFSNGGVDIGNNIALQALAWHLGWRVNGKVSVGLGIPAARLDMTAFAAAASACAESVALAGGGTQKRYEGGGVVSDFDDIGSVQQAFANACGGWFDDSNGKIGLFVAANDLSGSLVTLTDDDVLSGGTWKPFPDVPVNIVRGRNPDPASPNLYQPTDYPDVSIASIDGLDHVLPLDLGMVQDKARAQRIAKQALQRQQYQGLFTATFGARAWQLYRGQPLKLSFSPLGWSLKLFRVVSWTLNTDGQVNLTLREEATAIYAWAASETASVAPGTPVKYDPRNAPYLITEGSQIGVANGADVTNYADARVSNSVITVNADGTVSYFNGTSTINLGAVTITGLGYTGALNATKNAVTAGASFPGSPTNGDLHTDTSVTPHITYQRVSGSWVAAANLVTEGSHIGVENGADVTSNALAADGIPPTTAITGTGQTIADAFSVASGVGPVAIVVGTSAAVAVLGNVSVEAQYTGIATGSGSVSATLAVQARAAGGSWATVGSDTQSGTVGDSFTGTVSALTGIATGAAGEVRTVLTVSSGDGLNLSAPDSYWTAA